MRRALLAAAAALSILPFGGVQAAGDEGGGPAGLVHWVGEFQHGADLEHYAEWVLDQVGVAADQRGARKPDGYLFTELDMVWLFLTPDEAARASGLTGQGELDAAETMGVVSLPEPVEGGGPWVSPGRRGEQIIPPGLTRIGVPADEWVSSPSTGGVSVAVIDTGIDGRHSDLNVVGGYNCTQDSRGPGGYDIDLHGHASHVGGTIGARFNNIDVVGVAPGVALYSEAVFSTGSASGAMVLCGLNKALEHGADIISASLGGEHYATRCGGPSVYVNAWCKAAMRAVVVVAAGNDAVDAIFKSPANVDAPGIVTVGAVVDFDGVPGGEGRGSDGCGYQHRDDYLATFSNFGEQVDVVAPGGCVESTMPNEQLGWMSGTSMATPHVSGIFAAFMSEFPDCRGAAAVRTVVGYAERWARDHPEDGYDGWPGVNAPPMIRYVDEDPLLVHPDPENPNYCAFEPKENES
jgi:subtilisin family serine protease